MGKFPGEIQLENFKSKPIKRVLQTKTPFKIQNQQNYLPFLHKLQPNNSLLLLFSFPNNPNDYKVLLPTYTFHLSTIFFQT